MAGGYICDSVHSEAITHVQRMDVRNERQRPQSVAINTSLAIAGETVLRLAPAYALQLSRITATIAITVGGRYYETG